MFKTLNWGLASGGKGLLSQKPFSFCFSLGRRSEPEHPDLVFGKNESSSLVHAKPGSMFVWSASPAFLRNECTRCCSLEFLIQAAASVFLRESRKNCRKEVGQKLLPKEGIYIYRSIMVYPWLHIYIYTICICLGHNDLLVIPQTSWSIPQTTRRLVSTRLQSLPLDSFGVGVQPPARPTTFEVATLPGLPAGEVAWDPCDSAFRAPRETAEWMDK